MPQLASHPRAHVSTGSISWNCRLAPNKHVWQKQGSRLTCRPWSVYLLISRCLSDKCKVLVFLNILLLAGFVSKLILCVFRIRNNDKCGVYLCKTVIFWAPFKKSWKSCLHQAIKRHPIFSYWHKASANPFFAVNEEHHLCLQATTNVHHRPKNIICFWQKQANPKNILLVCNQQRTLITPPRPTPHHTPPHPLTNTLIIHRRTSSLFASNNERSSSTEEHHLLLTKASKSQEHLSCLQSTTNVNNPDKTTSPFVCNQQTRLAPPPPPTQHPSSSTKQHHLLFAINNERD